MRGVSAARCLFFLWRRHRRKQRCCGARITSDLRQARRELSRKQCVATRAAEDHAVQRRATQLCRHLLRGERRWQRQLLRTRLAPALRLLALHELMQRAHRPDQWADDRGRRCWRRALRLERTWQLARHRPRLPALGVPSSCVRSRPSSCPNRVGRATSAGLRDLLAGWRHFSLAVGLDEWLSVFPSSEHTKPSVESSARIRWPTFFL